jgi:hypothetical protein
MKDDDALTNKPRVLRQALEAIQSQLYGREDRGKAVAPAALAAVIS